MSHGMARNMLEYTSVFFKLYFTLNFSQFNFLMNNMGKNELRDIVVPALPTSHSPEAIISLSI